jgi:hypothetical protein
MSDELETPEVEAPPPAGESTPERTYSPAEFRAVQNEAKNLRARLREIEAQAAERANTVTATQAELEAIRTAHAAAAEELRTHRLRLAIVTASREDEALSGIDADLVLPHLRVEWNDDGTPKGVLAALRDAVKRFPSLVPAQAPNAPRVPAQTAAGKSASGTTDAAVQAKRNLYPVF